MENYRTNEELNEKRYNYFILYSLNISESDPSKYTSIIRSSCNNMSSSDNFSLRKRALINDAIEVLVNDKYYDENKGAYINNGGRKKEIAAYNKFKKVEASTALSIYIANRSFVTELDLNNEIQSRYLGFITKEELKIYLKKNKPELLNKIKIRAKGDIPIAYLFKIQQKFDSNAICSLYQYIDSNDKISIKEILNKLTEKNAIDLRKDKNTREFSNGITSDFRTYFSNENDQTLKENYDIYLKTKDIWSELNNQGLLSIEMSDANYLQYINRLKGALRCSVDDAKKWLNAGCNEFNIRIRQNFLELGLAICPYDDCGALISKGSQVCPICHRPLEIICWNCGNIIPYNKRDEPCDACGATIKSKDIFEENSKKLELLLDKKNIDLNSCLKLLNLLKNIIPRYSEQNSQIKEAINSYEKRINIVQRTEENQGSKYREKVNIIQNFIDRREFKNAFELVEKLKKEFNTYKTEETQTLKDEIVKQINEADRYVEIAKEYKAKNETELAIQNALNALSICEDNFDATIILKSFPPENILNLKAEKSNDGIKVTWDIKENSKDINFTVIRKIGSAPNDYSDGEIVAKDISVNYYLDAFINPAQGYYYGVFAKRFDVSSKLTATLQGILFFPNVINAQQEIVMKGVKVSWTNPQSTFKIDVYKKVGSYEKIEKDESLRIESKLTGFYDENCDEQTTYFIVASYKYKERIHSSSGVALVLKPYIEIEPISNFAIEKANGNSFKYTYEGSKDSEVDLYCSAHKLDLSCEKRISSYEFNNLMKNAKKLAVNKDMDGNNKFVLITGSYYYIYPVVHNDSLYIIQSPTTINMIESIRNFKKNVEGNILKITGELSKETLGFNVKINNQGYLKSLSEKGECLHFDRDVYEISNCLKINLKYNVKNYVTIFPENEVDGNKVIGSPIEIRPTIEVKEIKDISFKMKYVASAKKKFKVSFEYESDFCIDVPRMMIRKGDPCPLNINVGEECAKVPEVKLKKKLFSQKYSGTVCVELEPISKNDKIAAFLLDDTNNIRMIELKA